MQNLRWFHVIAQTIDLPPTSLHYIRRRFTVQFSNPFCIPASTDNLWCSSDHHSSAARSLLQYNSTPVVASSTSSCLISTNGVREVVGQIVFDIYTSFSYKHGCCRRWRWFEVEASEAIIKECWHGQEQQANEGGWPSSLFLWPTWGPGHSSLSRFDARCVIMHHKYLCADQDHSVKRM
jgi:hypothetical protein